MKLPTRDDVGGSTAPSMPNYQTYAPDFSVAQRAQAQMVATLEKTAAEVNKMAEDGERIKATELESKAKTEIMNLMYDPEKGLLNKMGGDAVGLSKEGQKQIDAIIGKYSSGVSHRGIAASLQSSLQAMKLTNTHSLMQHERKEVMKYEEDNMMANLGIITQQAAMDPHNADKTNLAMSEISKSVRELGARRGWSEAVMTDKINKASQGVYGEILKNLMMSDNPADVVNAQGKFDTWWKQGKLSSEDARAIDRTLDAAYPDAAVELEFMDFMGGVGGATASVSSDDVEGGSPGDVAKAQDKAEEKLFTSQADEIEARAKKLDRQQPGRGLGDKLRARYAGVVSKRKAAEKLAMDEWREGVVEKIASSDKSVADLFEDGTLSAADKAAMIKDGHDPSFYDHREMRDDLMDKFNAMTFEQQEKIVKNRNNVLDEDGEQNEFYGLHPDQKDEIVNIVENRKKPGSAYVNSIIDQVLASVPSTNPNSPTYDKTRENIMRSYLDGYYREVLRTTPNAKPNFEEMRTLVERASGTVATKGRNEEFADYTVGDIQKEFPEIYYDVLAELEKSGRPLTEYNIWKWSMYEIKATGKIKETKEYKKEKDKRGDTSPVWDYGLD